MRIDVGDVAVADDATLADRPVPRLMAGGALAFEMPVSSQQSARLVTSVRRQRQGRDEDRGEADYPSQAPHYTPTK